MDIFTETLVKTPTGDYIQDQVRTLMGKVRNITDQLPTYEQRRQGAYDTCKLILDVAISMRPEPETIDEIMDMQAYLDKHYNPNPPKDENKTSLMP